MKALRMSALRASFIIDYFHSTVMTALRALVAVDKSPYMKRGTNAREQFCISQSEVPVTEILPHAN